jgi:hypothetical protein
MTYREMIERVARIRGKHPLIIEVPVLTPRLSSYWLHLVTPVQADVARPLIEGLRNTTVVQDHRLRELMPLRQTDSTMPRGVRFPSGVPAVARAAWRRASHARDQRSHQPTSVEQRGSLIVGRSSLHFAERATCDGGRTVAERLLIRFAFEASNRLVSTRRSK